MAHLMRSTFYRILSNRIFSSRIVKPIAAARGFKLYQANVLKELKRRQKLNVIGPIPRNQYLEWNHGAEVFAFGKRLGEEFKIEILFQAFVHRSFILQEEMKQMEAGIENPNIELQDNEELAASGEELISRYTKNYVSHCLPLFPLEGIESIHKFLTSEETLGDISKNLGTRDIILSADSQVQVPIYAKTLKAIVGALLQCQGEKRAEWFVRDFIVTKLEGLDVNDFLELDDALKVVEDILKRDGVGTPEPRLIHEAGVNTLLATYSVGIFANKQMLGFGSGETTDIAIQMAASNVLKRFFNTEECSKPIRFDLTEVVDSPVNLRLSEWCSSDAKKTLQLASG